MEPITLYSNPRCSNCRNAQDALREAGIEFIERRYIDEPPSAAELDAIIDQLDGPVGELVRPWSAAEKKAATAQSVRAYLVEHPHEMQRPVLVQGTRSVIARPGAQVLEFLR